MDILKALQAYFMDRSRRLHTEVRQLDRGEQVTTSLIKSLVINYDAIKKSIYDPESGPMLIVTIEKRSAFIIERNGKLVIGALRINGKPGQVKTYGFYGKQRIVDLIDPNSLLRAWSCVLKSVGYNKHLRGGLRGGL